jgi:hypothetical protein
VLRTAVKLARPIRVLQNSSKSGDQWGQIKDVATGQILHTGRLAYIRRVARKRYNQQVTIK